MLARPLQTMPDLAQLVRRRSRLRPVVVHEDPVSRPLEIIELATAHRPPQQPKHTTDQQHTQGDENVETLDVTLQTMLQRKASTTKTPCIAHHQQRASSHTQPGKPRTD